MKTLTKYGFFILILGSFTIFLIILKTENLHILNQGKIYILILYLLILDMVMNLTAISIPNGISALSANSTSTPIPFIDELISQLNCPALLSNNISDADYNIALNFRFSNELFFDKIDRLEYVLGELDKNGYAIFSLKLTLINRKSKI